MHLKICKDLLEQNLFYEVLLRLLTALSRQYYGLTGEVIWDARWILSWDVSETHLMGIIKKLEYTEHLSFVLGPRCIKNETWQGTHAWD